MMNELNCGNIQNPQSGCARPQTEINVIISYRKPRRIKASEPFEKVASYTHKSAGDGACLMDKIKAA